MKNHLVAASLAALILAVPENAGATVMVGDDPVLFWNQQAQALLPGSTPVQSRAYAILNVALHDAVNATSSSPNSFYSTTVGVTGGDTRAAASQAARDVLVALNPGNTAQYDAALTSSLALVPNGAAKTQGIATGAAYASSILTARAGDGSNSSVAYVPTGQPGDWRPTPNAFAPAATPQWGDVKPFLLGSGDQLRPGPPPALNSAAYAAAFTEVMDIGAQNSAIRTADQSASAVFWASANASLAWLRIGLTLAEAGGLSTIDNARTMALLSTVMADSQIAGFDAKYEYDFWRPVSAIREGNLDGNPFTIADSTWSPLMATPAHPSYVSTHSTLSAASSAVLSSIFGNDDQICIGLANTSRCWANLDAAAVDASNSRLWSGWHFRFDNETGLQMGRQLGDLALAGSAFQAVPEPATWAMMLVGFGAVGYSMRNQRRKATVGHA